MACPACGGFTTLPRRSDTELASLYETPYFARWLGAQPTAAPVLELRLRDHEPRVAFLETLTPVGRVVDVGAATGFFLESARRRGWSVAAVEPNRATWGWARERFPLPPAAVSLYELARSERFDAICFWHSLEHIADPGAALEHAAQLLAPGGVLVIECPNAASLDRRLRRRRWPGWHLPFHTVHFTPAGLRARLAALDLHVEPVRYALWEPVAGAARLARRVVRRGADGTGEGTAAPFLLRQAPASPAGRLARVFSGREMLLVARRP